MMYWPREATVQSVQLTGMLQPWLEKATWPNPRQSGVSIGYFQFSICDWPHSICQYFNMALRLSGQTSIFGVVSFVSKSPLGIERQVKKLQKFTILTRKPRSHVEYWYIEHGLFGGWGFVLFLVDNGLGWGCMFSFTLNRFVTTIYFHGSMNLCSQH